MGYSLSPKKAHEEWREALFVLNFLQEASEAEFQIELNAFTQNFPQYAENVRTRLDVADKINEIVDGKFSEIIRDVENVKNGNAVSRQQMSFNVSNKTALFIDTCLHCPTPAVIALSCIRCLNPTYAPSYSPYSTNCYSCGFAHELLMRGFPAQAIAHGTIDKATRMLASGFACKAYPRLKDGEFPPPSSYSNAAKNVFFIPAEKVITAHYEDLAKFDKFAKTNLEPGRYHINVVWESDTSHIFVFGVQDGGIPGMFFDPQTGERWKKFPPKLLKHVSRSRNGSAVIYRVDNAPMSLEFITKFVLMAQK